MTEAYWAAAGKIATIVTVVGGVIWLGSKVLGGDEVVDLRADVRPAFFASPADGIRSTLSFLPLDLREFSVENIPDLLSAEGGSEQADQRTVVHEISDGVDAFLEQRLEQTVDVLVDLAFSSGLVRITLENVGNLPAKNIEVRVEGARRFGLLNSGLPDDITLVESEKSETVSLGTLSQKAKIELVAWTLRDLADLPFDREEPYAITHSTGLADIRVYSPVGQPFIFLSDYWFPFALGLAFVAFFLIVLLSSYLLERGAGKTKPDEPEVDVDADGKENVEKSHE